MANVAEIVMSKVIKAIEEGKELPWNKPWKSAGAPRNLISGKPYQGANAMILGFTTNYESPYFLSWKQCMAKGGRVKESEAKNGHLIVFYKTWLKKTGEMSPITGEELNDKRWVMRYYRVWNVEQCEDLKYPKIEKVEHNPIECCEKIIEGMPLRPEIRPDSKAYYNPNFDYVGMPDKGLFERIEEYYSTMFHELGHSTGHESRLKRKDFHKGLFGSAEYSYEELVAEMTATFLCGHCGIDKATKDNSAAYLLNWLGKLKKDPKMLLQASAQAQKAADYILGKKAEVANETE